jgi:hypothetical protein
MPAAPRLMAGARYFEGAAGGGHFREGGAEGGRHAGGQGIAVQEARDGDCRGRFVRAARPEDAVFLSGFAGAAFSP